VACVSAFPAGSLRIVRPVTSLGSEALAGLPADVAQLLSAPPVTEKKLLELKVTWSGLPALEARMAEALRVFVLTWDPLETYVPRPAGIAAVNTGSLGLEIAVHIPIWRLNGLAAARHEPIATTLTAIAGSAVVTAAGHEQQVTAGRYSSLVLDHSVPDLLADLPAGATLGSATISADPPLWDDIGLGTIQDVIQHAFGPVDLDRSQVELAALSPGQPGCPACAGKRFGFPADLAESQDSMCAAHRKQADAVIKERLARAERSNPDGWGALTDATIRRELPHLPNGLATGLAGASEAMDVVPEPADLAERARLVVEAAAWFSGRGRDFGVALGEDPEYGPDIPDWLMNFILNLGRAGLTDEALSVAEALAHVEPELQSVTDADLGVALAQAGRRDEARAQVAANLRAWPDDFWVRVHAGDALETLGDLDGARAHFVAARAMADHPADFEERAAAAERLLSLSRKERLAGGGPKVQRIQRAGKASRSKRRRGR
jgi:Flp pilus assembly protein TadD